MNQTSNRKGKCLQHSKRELNMEEKIQRLYHYTSFNKFVIIWLTKTLKFGEVTNMNDMFENNPSAQSAMNNMEYLDAYLEEKKKYKQISLTMDYDSHTLGCMSPMMWGQYADKSNGVCIEFDYNELIKKIDSTMIHDSICYEVQMPEQTRISKEDAQNWDHFFIINRKKEFFTKHDSWSKENEYRIVSKEKEFLNIDGAISAIYIVKYNSTERKCIEKLLERDENVYLKCVYKESKPQINTYLNVCDIQLRRENYKYIEEKGIIRKRQPEQQ